MQGVRLTRRGKIVIVVAAITAVIGFTWLTSGKALSCDWRGGFEPCQIVKIGK
jgi:hypothetical protein